MLSGNGDRDDYYNCVVMLTAFKKPGKHNLTNYWGNVYIDHIPYVGWHRSHIDREQYFVAYALQYFLKTRQRL